MTPPTTQYTKSGTINIAYQVFGSGPFDLVYIPGWVSNIDWMWFCPDLSEFLEELGKIARVILFDKRGTGLSDRVVDLSTIEERMEDITAVMDAVGSEKAVLFGHSEGGSVSALFSATYPERVISLITFGIFAQRKQSENYPWAPSREEREDLYNMIENNWCSGKMQLQALAPSKAEDPQFMNWLTSYFRYGASPRAALALTKVNTEVNIIDILKYIEVPTLIMQRTHDIDVKIAEGEFIAKRIKNSKFVKFDGNDHLFWIGNKNEILDEIRNFMGAIKSNFKPKKKLVSLLFGQLLDGIKKQFNSNDIYKIVLENGGTIVCKERDCFVMSFQVPGEALKTAALLQDLLKNKKVTSRLGVCLRAFSTIEKIRLTTEDCEYIKSIIDKAIPNQILVSQGVKHLLSGIPFDFKQETSIFDSNTQHLCKLYSARKSNKPYQEKPKNKSTIIPHNCFLENVLKIINQHLEDDFFTVEKLCKKIGISERQLQRKVKETTKKSPTQLITSLRLKKAKEVLMDSDYTVAEVAFQFGFSSPSYFTRCFKKEFGIRPTSIQNIQKNYTSNLQFTMS
ncbi:alpha/beta fold hydrolase [Tenacibaculum agarivorans]|uniref:alpha/beta fold hydrolase n=1 Tax=Tenacibaculum agarivorans TaxID=1908389 RepID=UPI00117C7E28|nr:alpha/beta fold hydrolase [Tenacibaculum agarivorans]